MRSCLCNTEMECVSCNKLVFITAVPVYNTWWRKFKHTHCKGEGYESGRGKELCIVSEFQDRVILNVHSRLLKYAFEAINCKNILFWNIYRTKIVVFAVVVKVDGLQMQHFSKFLQYLGAIATSLRKKSFARESHLSKFWTKDEF